MEGTPRMAASVAAETVPEYRTLMPRFAPSFIPEITSEGDSEQLEKGYFYGISGGTVNALPV